MQSLKPTFRGYLKEIYVNLKPKINTRHCHYYFMIVSHLSDF